jgi:hypothetical protein
MWPVILSPAAKPANAKMAAKKIDFITLFFFLSALLSSKFFLMLFDFAALVGPPGVLKKVFPENHNINPLIPQFCHPVPTEPPSGSFRFTFVLTESDGSKVKKKKKKNNHNLENNY